MTGPMPEEALFELLSLECRIGSDGALLYYNSLGKLHRVHGPAVEWADGRHEWYQDGQLHRLDGPAVEYSDGRRTWWQNGQRHRVDGPAVEYSNGYRAWYINGDRLTEAAWQQAVASMGIV